MRVNEHIQTMPAGYLFSEIAARVKDFEAKHPGERLIRMGIGDVTRPLSPHVARAFAEAAQGMAGKEGFFGYGPDGGYPFLIDAVIANDYVPRGVTLERDEVFISDGAKTDTASIQEIFSSDARIAVTDPVYPVYVDANAMAGRLGEYRDGRWSRLLTLPITRENGYVPLLPSERVDAIYLCYPNNPTGTVLTRAQLKKVVDWALENETLIIYDAAYKAFIADPEVPRSIFEIEGAKRTAVECCSFSKSAGFTGVRCAYTVIPKEAKGRLPGGELVSLNALWKRRMGSKYNGVSYPVQKAAAAAYEEQGLAENLENIAYYRNNARLLREALEQAGCEPVGGVHAPYVWFRVPGGLTGWQFFDHLINTARVVGTPGEGFGEGGKGCFRLTAFSTLENTREAVPRLLDAIKKI